MQMTPQPVEATFMVVERRTAAAASIEQIKRLIASGALGAGERLPAERDLATRLGVSRPTVREAVRALEALGVLESKAGTGTYVSDLSPELLSGPMRFILDANRAAIQELCNVRMVLEVAAARWAAPRITADELSKLEEAVDGLRVHVDEIEALVQADIAFHHFIHRASGNALLVALMSSISELDRQTRIVTSQRREAREGTIPQHTRILEELRAGDSEGAGLAMHEHLSSCWAEILATRNSDDEAAPLGESPPQAMDGGNRPSKGNSRASSPDRVRSG
jgi:DNA-binding FadR family transcriptional regulator